MSWTKLPKAAKAVAIFPFEKAEDDESADLFLGLNLGDEIRVLEAFSSDWFLGQSRTGTIGIFPQVRTELLISLVHTRLHMLSTHC